MGTKYDGCRRNLSVYQAYPVYPVSRTTSEGSGVQKEERGGERGAVGGREKFPIALGRIII